MTLIRSVQWTTGFVFSIFPWLGSVMVAHETKNPKISEKPLDNLRLRWFNIGMETTTKRNDRCFVCNDRAENGQEGFSCAPMVLPPFIKPVLVCGMCIIRAIQNEEHG